MDPIKRQMMQEMIEFAAKDQIKQHEWIKKTHEEKMKIINERKKDELAWGSRYYCGNDLFCQCR